MAREQINSSISELGDNKKPKDRQVQIMIDNAWNDILKKSYQQVKDKMSKNNINNYNAWIDKINSLGMIEKLNESFSEC